MGSHVSQGGQGSSDLHSGFEGVHARCRYKNCGRRYGADGGKYMSNHGRPWSTHGRPWVRRRTPSYFVVRRCTTLYDVVRRCTTLYDDVRRCTTLYDVVRRCTTLYDVTEVGLGNCFQNFDWVGSAWVMECPLFCTLSPPRNPIFLYFVICPRFLHPT